MSEKIDYSKGIYDARQLGAGRMFILGVQHMFAMFGATVLVPLLTGLSVSTTLLCAGLGTLLFHLITKKKVPAFLGSSFAYLGGFSIVAPMLADADGNLTVANTKMLPYACAAVAFSGLVYLVASLLISTFGIRRIMKFFPPVVTGPIIISIGLILAPLASLFALGAAFFTQYEVVIVLEDGREINILKMAKDEANNIKRSWEYYVNTHNKSDDEDSKEA